MTLFFCPACGARMVSAVERCSGGFLDRAHPSLVRPVAADEACHLRGGVCDCAGRPCAVAARFPGDRPSEAERRYQRTADNDMGESDEPV